VLGAISARSKTLYELKPVHENLSKLFQRFSD